MAPVARRHALGDADAGGVTMGDLSSGESHDAALLEMRHALAEDVARLQSGSASKHVTTMADPAGGYVACLAWLPGFGACTGPTPTDAACAILDLAELALVWAPPLMREVLLAAFALRPS